MTSSLPWIRQNYNVPAFRGVEVTYYGKPAVIVSGRRQYLHLRVEGERHPVIDHPTSGVRYPTLPLPLNPLGWCRFCMTERTIRKDGTVGHHHRHEARHFRPEERPCPGIGQTPWAICSWTVPAAAEVAA
jgi:hypothetical protein